MPVAFGRVALAFASVGPVGWWIGFVFRQPVDAQFTWDVGNLQSCSNARASLSRFSSHCRVAGVRHPCRGGKLLLLVGSD